MKRIMFFTLVAALFSTTIRSQEYNHSLEGITWIKIETESPVSIKAHDKDQISIRAEKAEEKPERAKGLKLITTSGNDNTGHNILTKREGNVLKVINLRDRFDPEVEILVPSRINISVNGYQYGNIEIANIEGEIEATTGHLGKVTITDVSGPVTASSTGGDIVITFRNVEQKSPISVTTSLGAIDLSIPEETKADIIAASTIGSIYTNFEIEPAEMEGPRSFSRRRIEGTINGGGVKISLTSSAGNIFIRQQ